MVLRCLNALPRARIYGETSFNGAFCEQLVAMWFSSAGFAKQNAAHTAGLHRMIRNHADISREDLANFTPTVELFATGLKAFLDLAFKAEPMWGFIATGTAAHVDILRMLFPDAKFIVTIREPREAFGEWAGYQSDRQAREAVNRARQAYGTMFRVDQKGEGKVLWIDQSEQEHHRHFLVKLFKFLSVEIPRPAWDVLKAPLTEHRNERPPQIPAFVVENAVHELQVLYTAAARYAEAQAARDI